MTHDEHINNYAEFMKEQVAIDPKSAGTSTYSWDVGSKKILQLLKDNGFKPEHSLLDLGCGTLPLLDKVYDYGCRSYVGVDICPEAIEAGKVLVGNKQEIAEFYINTDFGFDYLPKVDYIIAVSVLNHNPIAMFEEFIQNLWKIMKPTTKVFVTVWIGKKTKPWGFFKPPLSFFYSEKDMKEICHKWGHDYRIVDMKPYWVDSPHLLNRLSMIEVFVK